ncbi:hypothetical protein [Nitrospirillum amazonense]|uniref:hypothetical protein n=1 Tax=Nitrospirillum amazonense TaxID=28077 RepID=UPI0011A6619D|nr:hypothetical protein [Nitrospirillum amazonense]
MATAAAPIISVALLGRVSGFVVIIVPLRSSRHLGRRFAKSRAALVQSGRDADLDGSLTEISGIADHGGGIRP